MKNQGAGEKSKKGKRKTEKEKNMGGMEKKDEKKMEIIKGE